MQHLRLTIALLSVLGLVACGGGSSGGGTPPPPPATEFTASVTSIAGAKQDRLACNRGTADNFCDLRTYQIMVESFIDGDSLADYNTGYGTSHHKGDLQGIINSLDYIKSTGVNAIWLTPIFESIAAAEQSVDIDRLDATGYYTSNYFNVDPKFGTKDQFKTLVAEAHARGLYVFLDGVFGHYKNNIVSSPQSRLPANGPCIKDDGGTRSPSTAEACADFSAQATKDFFAEVAAHWITEYKIDGWRLDQAYQVPNADWDALRSTVNNAASTVTYLNSDDVAVHPLGYMVGEVWDGGGSRIKATYGSTAFPGLRSAFDFPTRYKLVQTLATQENLSDSWATQQPASSLNYGFDQSYPDHAMPNLMLGNHDLVRFGDLIQRAGLGTPDQDVYWDRHKAAFAFMAAFSGPITLYYGDEIGLEVAGFSAKVGGNCASAGLCDDHVSRSSGKVTGLSTREQNLKARVAALMDLRGGNPALSIGSRTHVYSDNNVYIDRKDAGSNHVLFLLNVKTLPTVVTLKASLIGSPAVLTDLLGGGNVTLSDDTYTITVPPLSGRFLSF